ncbi:MAG: dTDP-glucose 4,6-dehydratase, partial [Candidatus Chloroheliales bacterium]
MNLLVTGGAGFIGSNFIRYWLEQYPADKVVNLDLLTYAGNLANLDDVVSRFADRYAFARGDIGNVDLVEHLLAEYKIDAVVNFAAETHNSRAVLDPASFFRTNVLGTQGLMEACRRQKVARIHHVSTCEVFGDLDLDSADSFSEEHPYRPRTPYNAAKAGSDFVVRSYHETFGLPVTISTCSNNFGPYQFPEKLIPLFTTNAIDDLPLPLYRSSVNRREWLYVSDHCRAIDLILNRGRIGELYNIGSGVEQSVEQITDRVLALLGKPSSLKTYVPDRPGHDRRYLLNSSKIRRELGWQPEVDFDEGMRLTVSWYATNEDWWRPLKERLAVQEGSWVGLYIHLLKENPIVADNSSKRRFAPEDIYRMRTAADPHIAPDGKLVAMVVTTTDRAANRFRANIWGVSLDGEPPRRLTAGQKADSHPRWSADGRLAFISDRGREHEAEEAGGGGKSQIWLLDMNGAEARQLTFIREGVSGFAWSPDGKRIAFIAEVEEPALVEAEDSIRKLGAKMLSFTAPIEAALAEEPAPPTDSSGVPGMEGGEERVVVQPVGEEPGLGEEEKVEANKSKVITRLHYKFDGAGIYETKRSHIFVIDVPPASQFDFEAIFSEQDAIGKPKPKDKDKKDEGADKNLNERLKKAKERDPRDRSRQLTFGDYDDAEPTWTHDGRLIFVSNRLEDRDRRTSMSDLFIVDTANLA